MDAIETIDYKGHRIEIIPDQGPMNPVEEWDQLGTMVCFHRRYSLGHKHNWRNPDEMMRGLAIEADPTVENRIEYWENGKGWSQLRNKENSQRFELGKKVELACHAADEKIKELIQSTIDKHYITLPLYLYDHSGITISTSPFSCPWDSGQVGIIYITKKKIVEEYGWKKLGKNKRKKIIEYLVNEVECYDQYLTGDVYGFRAIELDEDGDELEELDSCWGYFGRDWKENGLLAEAQSAIDYRIKQKEDETIKEFLLEREVEDFVRNCYAL